MSCLPCGKVNNLDRIVVRYYKMVFEKTGKVYYVYRLGEKERFNFVEKSYFNKVFQEQIKPNFSNGSEYFHISEFK